MTTQVPRYEDIYEEDSENEDEPNRKRRREEEEEEEDSLLPRKERWKRKREELLFTYYELSGLFLWPQKSFPPLSLLKVLKSMLLVYDGRTVDFF